MRVRVRQGGRGEGDEEGSEGQQQVGRRVWAGRYEPPTRRVLRAATCVMQGCVRRGWADELEGGQWLRQWQ